jgi:mono/diheme cytochrome c family protein
VKEIRRQVAAGLSLALAAFMAIACVAPGGPEKIRDPRFSPDAAAVPARPALDATAPPPLPAPVAARCLPARAEPLPARTTAMRAADPTSDPNVAGPIRPATDTTMFTADLFNLFRSHCGGCHVETKLGNFQATLRTFSKSIDSKVMASIKSDDTAHFMPPPAAGGKPFSTRPAGDPVRELATLLDLWIAQGKSDDGFVIAKANDNVASVKDPTDPLGYALTPTVGQGLTNLGDCIPEKGLLATSTTEMDALDANFAAATTLPTTLAETDLVTWDGESLARRGLIAFAPAYPLWSDDAAKIRHIRLPRGTKIGFDATTQTFSFPPHTRFYKTFLKEVIDRDGNRSYRKIETRIILARPDHLREDDTAEVTSLFGTYIWNADETEATLLRDPLRNGQPFRDRLIQYVTDEPKDEEIRRLNPDGAQFVREVENPGLVRHYAVPGGARCLECHMGSPNKNAILGFSPLQIARRPSGTGGVIEPVNDDELSQLARFIDYGLFDGLDKPEDVLPLERSQGARPPRNEHELRAQGYMLGACSGCHNPRGFPSVKSPEIRDMLDFLPSATGGIFQFPLERTSPLRRRGADQNVPMPYITPSLREYPVAAAGTPNWTPKWVDCKSVNWKACLDKKSTGILHVDAPWRSLLYRNVDAPFAYADDYVVFPRMPMHGAGHDCRAPRLFGKWMVSVPAVRKHPDIPEDAVPGGTGEVDREAQPYTEVKPGEPGYDAAAAAAKKRLDTYEQSARYQYCPDTTDIVDRKVLQRANAGDPLVPPADDVFDPKDLNVMLMPGTGVPIRPHWVTTDLTDPAGDWFPRRPDWKDALVDGMVAATGLSESQKQEQAEVLAILSKVKIDDALRRFALGKQPFGLWTEKAGCDFAGQAKADAFAGEQRPRWMALRPPRADAPVYQVSPGEAIYTAICFNCHGPNADSKGLMSEAIMLMTGGDARVANFRDGLFGPVDAPGKNVSRVFANLGQAGVNAEDWGARYMAWMALGGTRRQLPNALLNIVATTPVLGAQRSGRRINPEGSPNMLKLAQELCTHVLPAHVSTSGSLNKFLSTGIFDWGEQTGLLDGNGDAEMWQRLCSLNNRAVVRVPFVNEWKDEMRDLEIDPVHSLYWADAYPVDADVMDHRGRIQKGVRPDNLMPLCLRKPGDPKQALLAERYRTSRPVGGASGASIPYCPESLFEAGDKWRLQSSFDQDTQRFDLADVRRWAIRGAVNAGLAVYLYLDQLERGSITPSPPFNRCEQLARAR